ncbi:hypothetical protein LV704_19600 [Flagellimonas sp. CMM7]|nr:hypothetical protein [Flagellimonas sp. CMM7]UII79851.1 hypothetical protein LV704_19600 [Flagellimonas sp. CMM7]
MLFTQICESEDVHILKGVVSKDHMHMSSEYVVVTSENTKLIGGININIDYKKSDYEKVLRELESLLQNRKKLRIRNQTDLLNAMSKLGFEYVNAYNGKENNISLGSGKDVEVIGGQAKYRVNMVFKKKEKYQS